MASVMVCDDAALHRDTVRRVVSLLPGIDRVITAGSGEEAIARFEADRPDLVLMDVRMPGIGGVEAARRLMTTHPAATVVMLTTATDPEAVGWAVVSGARGYIAKDATREELAAMISLVLGTVQPPVVARATPEGRRPVLTEREQQVLEGMCRGRSNGEIGRSLFLSEDTIKTHARRLFRKLGAADRAAAVAAGFRWGMLT
jgi:DNA-binding NarL/FixJ family response regulator